MSITSTGEQRRSRPGRAGAVLAAVVAGMVALVALASPASAHALVSRSDPADQARLPEAPPAVTIWFSESVSPSGTGMTVNDQRGHEVQTEVHQPEPDALMAMLPADLADGTYVATYRIVSEDGHPISGSIVFGVGHAALADVSTLTTSTDTGMDTLAKAGQFLVYTGALAAAGIVFFLALLHDGGAERRPLGRVVLGGAAMAVAGMVVVALAQAAQVTGAGIGSLFATANLGDVFGQGLGAQNLALLIGLGLCLVARTIPPGRTSGRVLAVAATLGATVPFVLWGHAMEGSRRAVAIPADVVHLVTAAVWFGGLVGLAAVLRARGVAGASANGAASVPAATTAGTTTTTAGATVTQAAGAEGPAPAAAATLVASGPGANGAADPNGSGPRRPDPSLHSTVHVVRRFSATAFVTLILLTAAGLVLGFTLTSIGDLMSTPYGRLLLAKVAVVAVVAAAAGYNRFLLLPWLVDDPGGEAVDEVRLRNGWKILHRTVRFEALAIVGVLALTAVLVNTTPGPGAPPPSTPLSQTQSFDGGKASLSVSPNRPGVNSMHVDVAGPDGRPLDVQGVQAEFTLADKGIGPIARQFVHGGPGHYMLENSSDLSIAGEWTIDVTMRIDDFDEATVTFTDTLN